MLEGAAPAEWNMIGKAETYDDDIGADLGHDRNAFLAADRDLDFGNDFDGSVNLGDDLGNSLGGASAVGTGNS
jgi:hypothetical protein